jgi:hypothetical protein
VTARVAVQHAQSRPFDQSPGPVLNEVTLTETFSGDIEATSVVRALQMVRTDKSASMISLQRVQGRLHGRKGTFVLQGTEIVDEGKVSGRWFIVPGSGTGELAGLRGEGGFEGSFGKESVASLDYWFE